MKTERVSFREGLVNKIKARYIGPRGGTLVHGAFYWIEPSIKAYIFAQRVPLFNFFFAKNSRDLTPVIRINVSISGRGTHFYDSMATFLKVWRPVEVKRKKSR